LKLLKADRLPPKIER